ncbi:MAG TPA: endo-1,4-beta-xylanase [Bacteroidaceae bacterium]|nr:endo-1,4-beta-xylanase [Bacteroidaceae bacterium]
MKRIMLLSILFSLFIFDVNSQRLTLNDFEDYSIGTPLTMKTPSGSISTESTAVVTVDPEDPNNKVLMVTTNNWNTFIEILLPESLTGAMLSDQYEMISFDLYRPDDDPSDWKKFEIYSGSVNLYTDGIYPYQGDKGSWQDKRYYIGETTSSSRYIYLGFNSNNSICYIDNIVLYTPKYSYDYTDPEQTPRYWADLMGKNIGVAITPGQLDYVSDRRTLSISRNFNMIVAENCMKWYATEPSRDEFSWENSDKLYNFAQSNNMKLRGHALVWHSQLPSWVSSDGIENDNNWTKAELLDILKNHITQIVSRYKGKIVEWDVINECLDDNQWKIKANPDNGEYILRENSIWTKVIGESFIDSAFVWAHRADPDAKLYINEYNAEHWSGDKTKALYYLVKRLKESGVPIDGVGLQAHLTLGKVTATDITITFNRYNRLGLNSIITELDIPIPIEQSGLSSAYKQQAADFKIISDLVASKDNSPSLLVWGLTDNDSWLNTDKRGEPLLLNKDYDAKPAFTAVLESFRKKVLETGLCNPVEYVGPQKEYVNVYTITGFKVALGIHRSELRNLPSGLYIIDGRKEIIN